MSFYYFYFLPFKQTLYYVSAASKGDSQKREPPLYILEKRCSAVQKLQQRVKLPFCVFITKIIKRAELFHVFFQSCNCYRL